MGKSEARQAAVTADTAEKFPFLENGPGSVKLTPSWEQRNLPAEELNLKGLDSEVDKAALELDEPADRCNLVYMTFVLHGIGTLMPWNMFITAKDYFVDYKLGADYTGQGSLWYASDFMNYLGFAAQVPNFFFSWLNIFVQLGGTLSTRIIGGILIEVGVFVTTVVLAMVDSSQWPGVFFWITMVSVVVLNVAGGIYQNTVYGLAAKLPFKYTGAVVLGSNICGVFTAVVNIVSKFVTTNDRTAAIYYFITALFILLACFDTFFALPLNRFYRYNELKSKRAEEENRAVQAAAGNNRIPYWYVFKRCFPQCFNVFFVFFVTLSIFPSVHSDIKMSDPDFFLGEYFIPVTCFLTFNVSAMLGNMMSGLFQWPGPRFLWIAVVLRALFIPFFLLCAYTPLGVPRLMNVYIANDWVYWTGAFFMGLTSGYFSSLGMMYCPQTVEPEYAATAGMFSAACLVSGIFFGINFANVMPIIVSKIAL